MKAVKVRTNTKQKVREVKVHIAVPLNWKNRDSVMKRIITIMQSKHPQFAISEVINPAFADVSYYIYNGGKHYRLKKVIHPQFTIAEKLALKQL